MKRCPHCKGTNVIIFDSDEDWCTDCKKHFDAVEDENVDREAIKTELKNARKMLLAVVIAAGGKVEIPDEIIQSLSDDRQLQRFNDAAHKRVVLSVAPADDLSPIRA